MAESKRITVTPNVKKCLDQLKAAVKALPEGDLKKNSEGAIRYLSRTFQGKPQPGKGVVCPGGGAFIKG
jgi:hypothetical protein